MNAHFPASRDSEVYVSHMVTQQASIFEAESRKIAEDTLSVYCPYLVRRAFLTDDEKKMEDSTALYKTFVSQAETQHEHKMDTSGRRAHFIQQAAGSDDREAVDKALNAYMAYLTGPAAVSAREEASVSKCVETYCPILVRYSQMDRESKATHDAASLYIPYLLQTPAERAAAAALEHKKDSMAAAKYTSALILRTSESVLDAAGKSAGRDARTYIAKLLQSAALDRETVAASVSAIIYAENLLWKLALEASPARQAWLRRVEGGRAAGANELAGQDMLVQQAAARLSAKGRDVVAGALDLAYREYMLAISKPNDVVAGEWASLVIQSELVAIANGRPVSPVQDGPMEAGLVRIAQELVGTAE